MTIEITEPESPAGIDPRSAYAVLGGEQGVRTLVDGFYDRMALDPRYAELRAVHPPSLESARDKLFLFFSGWMGGPSLYIERYGHPRLRARHLPFAIGERERDQWLACMRATLSEDFALPEPFILGLMGQLYQTADWMRNQAG